MKSNNFEKKIAEKFDNFSVKPPEKVWSNIENQINNKKEKTFFNSLLSNKYFLILLLGVSSVSVAYHLENNPLNIDESINPKIAMSDSIILDNQIELKEINSKNDITLDISNQAIVDTQIKIEKINKTDNEPSTRASSFVSELNKQLVIITEHFENESNGLYNVKMSLSDTSNVKHIDWVCREYDFYSSNMTLPIAFADSAEAYDVEAVVTFKDNDKKLFSTEVSVMKVPRVAVPQNFNPKRQSFYIRSKNLSYFKIEIINPRSNKVVFMSKNQNERWNGEDLLGKKCEAGAYLVELNFKGNTGEIRTEITKIKLNY